MFVFKATKEIKIKLNEEQYKQISSKDNIKQSLLTNKVFGYDIILNESIIGFAMLRQYDDGCFFLWDYAIDYRYQNNHYGTTALIELIEYLKNNFAAKEISVTYIFGNEVAGHVYEKVGFIETDIVDEDDIHEVNMVLKLAN